MSGLAAGWISAKASDACALVQSGGTPKAGFTSEPGVPFLKVYNLVHQRIDFDYRPQFVSDLVHSGELGKSIAYPGDVLMNIVGPPLGKVAVVPQSFPEWNLNQALTVFRPSEIVGSKWLYYFLCGGESVLSVINETRGSAGQVNISLSQCRAFDIPIPPLAEQRRIVAKLDTLTARTARACADLDRIPILAARYKQAVLAAAFKGDLISVPSTAKAVRIEEVTTQIFDGPFGSNLKSDDYATSGVRVVRLENIAHLSFLEDKRTFVSEEKFESLSRHSLQADDVLFSSFVAEQVRVCVLPALDTLAINKADCFCIRVDRKRCDPRFLAFRLACESTFEHFEAQVHGATRPRINLRQLKAFEFDLPPLEWQIEIVRRIERAFTEIERLTAEAAAARRLLDRLDQAVLAKAFRGELVPQDPADEPASVLLARICAERAAAPKARRGRREAA